MKNKSVLGAIAVGCIIAGLYCFLSSEKPVEEQLASTVSELKPGVYKVGYDMIDSHGWRAFFSMEVSQTGEITSVKYDYDNLKGVRKTQDVPYNKAMRSKQGVGPADYCPRFEKNLIIYQDPEEVDAITAATSSSKVFKDFSRMAYKAAKSGDQTPIIVIQPEPATVAPQGGSN